MYIRLKKLLKTLIFLWIINQPLGIDSNGKNKNQLPTLTRTAFFFSPTCGFVQMFKDKQSSL